MTVACSKTGARGWRKAVGELRDVDEDRDPTALEVRRQGDSEGDVHTSKTGTQTLRESFSDGPL